MSDITICETIADNDTRSDSVSETSDSVSDNNTEITETTNELYTLIRSIREDVSTLLDYPEDTQIILIHIADKLHELDVKGTVTGNGIYINLSVIPINKLTIISSFLKGCIFYYKNKVSPPRHYTTPIEDTPQKTTIRPVAKIIRAPKKEKATVSESATSLLKVSNKSVRIKGV